MQIREDTQTNRYQIRGYQPGQIIINNQVHTSSLILTPDVLQDNWPPRQPEDLTPQALSSILALKPKIILLGTGQHFVKIPHRLLAPIYSANLGVEIMSTGAACRTFVALSSEGRAVVAALLI